MSASPKSTKSKKPPQSMRRENAVAKHEYASRSGRKDVVKSSQQRLASPAEVNQNYEMFKDQLLEIVPSVLNVRFYEMYKDAWSYVEDEQPHLNPEQHWRATLEVFQNLLGAVAEWDMDRIEEETESVMSELPYLREALRQMLIARVSILMSIRHDRRTHGDFEFVMPPDTQIIHTFFIRAAKRIRGRAALYYHLVDDVEREDNTMEAEDIIRRSLEKSIPALVPLEQVVQRHLIEAPEDDVVEETGDDDDVLDEEEDDENDENDDSDDEDDDEDEDDDGDDEDDEDDEDEDDDSEAEDDEDSIAQEVADEAPEEDYDENAVYEDDPADLGPGSSNAPPLPLAPEDMPADKSAAETTVFTDDNEKKVRLKEKVSALQDLIDELYAKRRRVPAKHKTVRASLDEEITAREAQVARLRKKIEKKKSSGGGSGK